MARIFITDEHDLLRAGLREILRARADFEVCGEASAVEEAVRVVARSPPDVVILGQRGPEPTEHLPRLAGIPGPFGVLMLAREGSPPGARRAFALGAQGYLLTSDSRDDVLSAVAQVASKESFLSPQLKRAPPERRRRAPLTARENEVLALVVAGKRTLEIASLLDISRKTVETHRGSIMRKLGIHRLADLVRYAMANNLCESALEGVPS